MIRLYYGIGVPQAGAGEIADGFGITRSRVDMLCNEALRRMKPAARCIDAGEAVGWNQRSAAYHLAAARCASTSSSITCAKGMSREFATS